MESYKISMESYKMISNLSAATGKEGADEPSDHFVWDSHEYIPNGSGRKRKGCSKSGQVF